MFSARERDELRNALVAAARDDARVTGIALFGSAAIGREDAWSDIDLALGVAEHEVASTLADWTAKLYDDYGAVHHLDGHTGRIFLLANTLQVDLVIAPAEELGPRGPKFRVLAGAVGGGNVEPPPQPSVDELAGRAWLHAVQVRTCLGRRRDWQALRMLAELRDAVMSLACLRAGLPAVYGLGFDLLAPDVNERFRACVPGEVAEPELRRAFAAALALFLDELDAAAPELRRRLEAPVGALVD